MDGLMAGWVEGMNEGSARNVHQAFKISLIGELLSSYRGLQNRQMARNLLKLSLIMEERGCAIWRMGGLLRKVDRM